MTSQTDTADDFELAPPDKLYAHHRRQLSAMMDGELSPDEAKFMLRRLEHDSGLSACWERWQVCGDVLRGRRNALLPADFSQRVARAIAGEDVAVAVSRNSAPARSRLARWGGGGALAASVAVMALLVARQMPGDVAPATPETPAGIVAQAPAASAPAGQSPAPATPDTASSNAAALATGVAAAEAPRRAAQRRARAQNRRIANRVQASGDVRQPPTTAAAELPAIAIASAPSTLPPLIRSADPFAAQPLVTDIAPARPWPRAILPAYPANGALSAGYGDGAASAAFDPFQPRLQPSDVEAVPSPDVSADGEDAEQTVPH